MNWKDKFEKVNGRIKTDVSDKISLEKRKMGDRLTKFENSDFYKFNAGDKKTKLNIIRNRWHQTGAYRAFDKARGGFFKVISFIIAHIVPIAIAAGILIVGSNLAIVIVGVVQGLGSTPHYYCEINPTDAVKASVEYKQYCENNNDYIKMKQLNGHYVVQDGAGPCTDCSVVNMLMRFYTNNDINFFNYLWQNNGQYTPLGNSFISGDNYNNKQYNMRRFINGGSTAANNSKDWSAKDTWQNGSKVFAKSHGKENYTMANWGYLRDPTIEGDIGSANLSLNENWVWDLSLDNDSEGTDWSCAWGSGRNISIEGTTATFVHVTSPFESKEQLVILLEAHPAGIVVYRQYSAGHNHAILVTSYDRTSDTFMVVDPALGLMGGYETSADSCVKGGGVTIFSNDILRNPQDSSFLSYTYIEEG